MRSTPHVNVHSRPASEFSLEDSRLLRPTSNVIRSVDPRVLLDQLDEVLAGQEAVAPLAEARFLEAHAFFENSSDQRKRIIELFCKRVASVTRVDRPFRVLSIGGGTGDVDVPMAKRLSLATGEVLYVGVDPNRFESEALQRGFASAALAGVSLEVALQTFDDFKTSHRFELIHFVHSLYYMPDPAAALERALDLLTPHGVLVVFQAPREALNELAVRFYDKEYHRPTLFAGDYAKILEERGWKFERQRLDARLDVTPLINGDPKLGPLLRDFIVQADAWLLPESVRNLVDRYLHSIAFEQGNRSLIAHPVEAFFVTA
jgi:SAM-dependent methyltransferase